MSRSAASDADIKNLQIKRISSGRRCLGMKECGFSRVLKKHCDTVWEYDARTDKMFIHHDRMFPDMQGKQYTTKELDELYSKILFKADCAVWKKYLSRRALLRILGSDSGSAEFELRFEYSDREPEWYKINIERLDDNRLIISDKNIYGDIKKFSLQRIEEQIFDNILYIDVKNGSYLIHYTNNDMKPSDRFSEYREMAEDFIRRYSVDDEVDRMIEELKLENVILELAKNNAYTVYGALHDENGRLEYKKLVFSYLDEKKKIITLIRIDVSDTVREYELLVNRYKKESYRDALTGAYNRKYYEDELKNTTRRACVALIDLDDFKLCNDIYGHDGGDGALVMLVKAVKSCITDKDLIVRYGGDEFLLIMNGIDAETEQQRLNEIHSRITGVTVPKYHEIRISVSIGGVVMAEGETVAEAVRRADKLMYRAKNMKNTVVTEKTAIQEDSTADSFDADTAKQQILIVDDSEINRDMLAEMLGGDFRILTAAGGAECIEMLNRYGTGISLVLLDIVMPEVDGFDVLAYMNQNNVIEDIPVIMISGDDSEAYIRRAYAMGVSDYIARPFDAKVVFRRVFNIIKLYSKQRRLVSLVSRQMSESERNSRMMIDIFSRIVEFRNGENEMHVERVSVLTGMMLDSLIRKTDRYNLSWEDRSLIVTASALHDIGKMAIDERILNRQGRLSYEEYESVKTHTILGARMLEGLENYKNERLIKIAIEICRWHHERYDGRGYPDGLVGDEIPISAQVVSIADVYDALVGKRSYKKEKTHEQAVKMILSGECGNFNPLLLECFKEIESGLPAALADDGSIKE